MAETLVDRILNALDTLPPSKHLDELRSALTAVYTTSSELLGEIGLAIRRFEKASPNLPADVQRVLDDAMREVRRVWRGL